METTTFLAAILGGLIALIFIPILEKPVGKLIKRLVKWEDKVKARLKE